MKRSTTDFYHETSVRSHSGVNLLIHGFCLCTLVVVHFCLLGKLEVEFPFSIIIWLLYLSLISSLVWFFIVFKKGGIYKVMIVGDRLKIDSPDQSIFGASLDVSLSQVGKLSIRSGGGEGIPNKHWLVFKDGTEFCLDETWTSKPYLPALKLSSVIQKLNDQIPLESEQNAAV